MKADTLPISKVFMSGGDVHYVLPHFQREYTWDKENWKTLLEDAVAVYTEVQTPAGAGASPPPVEHFLGSIVVIHDGIQAGMVSVFNLVDGQQRLTSISLLLKALARAVEESRPQLAKKIERLLVNEDEQTDLYFKLLPTAKHRDRDAYRAVIRGTEPPNESKIGFAYAYFSAQVATLLDDGVDPERFAQVLLNAFQVVFINLDRNESPYRIFESLNGKGKPLTQADLVRNYVAMKLPIGRQERVFSDCWTLVEKLRETELVGRVPELTAFLRHYVAMRTGVLCNEAHVYARFRDRAEREFSDPAGFESELVVLARFAVHYDKLIRPVGFADREIADAMDRLNTLEINTGYPFLLSAVDAFAERKLSRAQFLEILAVLENYMVRRFIVGEPAAYLNRIFPTLWRSVKLEDPGGSLRTALAGLEYPRNANVLRAIERRRAYEKRGRTTLVLETINRRLSTGSGGYTVLDARPTLEHIMPQTLSDAWKRDLGPSWEQTHRDYLHTLGNLTLVTGEWNLVLSNAAFAEKRSKLAGNALKINSDYFGQPLASWGGTEIRDRARLLGNKILKIWPSFIAGDPLSTTAIEQRDGRSASRAEFHSAAFERVAAHIGSPLTRISPSRFESADRRRRLVGMCSRKYLQGEEPNFWFGFGFAQRDFLTWPGESWVALECESPLTILLIPFSHFEPLLSQLNITEERHWHVVLYQTGDKLLLNLPLTHERRDLTPWLLPPR